MHASALPLPDPGDIVYCRFPESMGKPGPKPRPALVTGLATFEDGTAAVEVAYGTSRNTDDLRSGEFLVSHQDGEAYRLAGLSHATKFNFHRRVVVPYTDEWFRVPPAPAFGQTPKLGVLHPSLLRRAEAAWRAAASRRQG